MDDLRQSYGTTFASAANEKLSRYFPITIGRNIGDRFVNFFSDPTVWKITQVSIFSMLSLAAVLVAAKTTGDYTLIDNMFSVVEKTVSGIKRGVTSVYDLFFGNKNTKPSDPILQSYIKVIEYGKTRFYKIYGYFSEDSTDRCNIVKLTGDDGEFQVLDGNCETKMIIILDYKNEKTVNVESKTYTEAKNIGAFRRIGYDRATNKYPTDQLEVKFTFSLESISPSDILIEYVNNLGENRAQFDLGFVDAFLGNTDRIDAEDNKFYKDGAIFAINLIQMRKECSENKSLFLESRGMGFQRGIKYGYYSAFGLDKRVKNRIYNELKTNNNLLVNKCYFIEGFENGYLVGIRMFLKDYETRDYAIKAVAGFDVDQKSYTKAMYDLFYFDALNRSKETDVIDTDEDIDLLIQNSIKEQSFEDREKTLDLKDNPFAFYVEVVQ